MITVGEVKRSVGFCGISHSFCWIGWHWLEFCQEQNNTYVQWQFPAINHFAYLFIYFLFFLSTFLLIHNSGYLWFHSYHIPHMSILHPCVSAICA